MSYVMWYTVKIYITRLYVYMIVLMSYYFCDECEVLFEADCPTEVLCCHRRPGAQHAGHAVRRHDGLCPAERRLRRHREGRPGAVARLFPPPTQRHVASPAWGPSVAACMHFRASQPPGSVSSASDPPSMSFDFPSNPAQASHRSSSGSCITLCLARPRAAPCTQHRAAVPRAHLRGQHLRRMADRRLELDGCNFRRPPSNPPESLEGGICSKPGRCLDLDLGAGV